MGEKYRSDLSIFKASKVVMTILVQLVMTLVTFGSRSSSIPFDGKRIFSNSLGHISV